MVDPANRPLRNLTERCLTGFDTYARRGGQPNIDRADDLRRRLETWADWSGVRARPGYCLDDRLRRHGDIRKTFEELLEMINLNIAEASPPSLRDSQPDSANNHSVGIGDDSITKGRSHFRGAPWGPIVLAVDELMKLTSAVRKSSASRNTLSVPPGFTVPDDEVFESTAKLLVRKRFPSARTTITDQIGHTMTVRRRFLFYKQHQESKMQAQPAASFDPIVKETTSAESTVFRSNASYDNAGDDSYLGSDLSALPHAPISKASSVNTAAFKRARFSPSIASGSIVGTPSRQDDDAELHYPEMPMTVDNLPPRCDYCSRPFEKPLSESEWRLHVRKDTLPYVCLSEVCTNPPQFFADERSWWQHMMTHGESKDAEEDWTQRIHLTYWYCSICEADGKYYDTPEPETRLDRPSTITSELGMFSSAVMFRSHLKEEHKIEGKTIESHLLRRKRRGVREALYCPLCEQAPWQRQDKEVALPRHIGDHLVSLGLLSLPTGLKDTEGAKDDHDGSSSFKVASVDENFDLGNPINHDNAFSDIDETMQTPRVRELMPQSRAGDETLWAGERAEVIPDIDGPLSLGTRTRGDDINSNDDDVSDCGITSNPTWADFLEEHKSDLAPEHDPVLLRFEHWLNEREHTPNISRIVQRLSPLLWDGSDDVALLHYCTRILRESASFLSLDKGTYASKARLTAHQNALTEAAEPFHSRMAANFTKLDDLLMHLRERGTMNVKVPNSKLLSTFNDLVEVQDDQHKEGRWPGLMYLRKLHEYRLACHRYLFSPPKTLIKRMETELEIYALKIAEMPPTHPHDSYTVGIVCALDVEKVAVEAMLDEEHIGAERAARDDIMYSFGRIGAHNVVVACRLVGEMSKASAAMAAASMMRSFPIRIGLMVGIGSGVPSDSVDIRLGDVVVSQPTNQHGGVLQWDFGKMEGDGVFRGTGTLNKPPRVLLNALAELQMRHEVEEPEMAKHVEEMLSRHPRMAEEFGHQGRENDVLFEGEYDHAGGETCERCDKTRLVPRSARADEREIVVHAGNIASGNVVMKDGKTRDRIAASEGVICFEMEAAGLMDSFPCLVIRGICDYADSHKNKRWQRYAATAAAAYMKELLLLVPAAEVVGVQPVQETTARTRNLPVHENQRFVGRHYELDILEQSFFGRSRCRSVAIVGLGGIGKTEVALSFACSVWKKRSEFSVFWVSAVSGETMEKAFEEIAEMLQLPLRPDDQKAAKDVVCRYLTTPVAGNWLMIVDNADDLKLLEEDAKTVDLLHQLPRSEHGLTLFTTRSHTLAWSVAGNNVIKLGRPSDEDARSMLQQLVIRPESLRDEGTTALLLAKLDNLPLSIAQAAAYINVNHISASGYLDLIVGTEDFSVDGMSRRLCEDIRHRQVDSAIATTWIISFQQIAERNADAAGLLRYISCIEWKAIPRSILPRLRPKARTSNAVGLLCSYSFLEKRRNEKTYDMHRLVHLAMRIWDKRYGGERETKRKGVLHLSRIFPSGEYEKREIWRAYLPHAARILRSEPRENEEGRGALCKCVGSCLRVQGKSKDAVFWLEESCSCYEGAAEDDSDRLSAQYALAQAYQANGQVKMAVELLHHVVAIGKETLAEDHPSRLAFQNALAQAYNANRYVKKALELFTAARIS